MMSAKERGLIIELESVFLGVVISHSLKPIEQRMINFFTAFVRPELLNRVSGRIEWELYKRDRLEVENGYYHRRIRIIVL